MVLDYYKLAEQPFGVTPDPRYLYLSATHREAMASALYAVSAGRGFTALIAAPGMGKTTLLFDFLQRIRNSVKTVFLFQSQCGPQDLLRSLLADLGIDDDGSDNVRMHRKLNECLLSGSRQGKQLVVVLDEAQNLDEAALELVRMLSNFETPRKKLMHLILAGQPQLAEKLSHPRLIQLRQRISIIARLEPFDKTETQLYIDHRLRVAGYDFARPIFTKQAQDLIASYASGIPRNINNICFNAMSLGCVAKQRTIEAEVVQEVLGDLDLGPLFAEPTNRLDKPQVPVPSSPSCMPTASSPIRTWAQRSALALGLVLVLAAVISWPLFTTKRHAASVPASRPSGTAGSSGAADFRAEPSEEDTSVSPSFGGTSQSTESEFVVVHPDETLCRISIQDFGKCDQQILARFRVLNPWLSNPDHIEVGQKIRIPSVNRVSRTILPIAERLPAALGSGAEKP